MLISRLLFFYIIFRHLQPSHLTIGNHPQNLLLRVTPPSSMNHPISVLHLHRLPRQRHPVSLQPFPCKKSNLLAQLLASQPHFIVHFSCLSGSLHYACRDSFPRQSVQYLSHSSFIFRPLRRDCIATSRHSRYSHTPHHASFHSIADDSLIQPPV